jgi:hypothetical protein
MEDAKAARLHESFLAAKSFNAAQTAANNEAKVRLFQEDRRNAEELKIKFKESMAEEAAKEEARRAKIKKLQQFHLRQIDEKQQRMSMLQDETNEEIRDMERQFAIQVCVCGMICFLPVVQCLHTRCRTQSSRITP